jgi:hypothetical protein
MLEQGVFVLAYLQVMESTYILTVCVLISFVRLISMHVEKISVRKPRQDFFEQSSTEIWRAVIVCVRVLERLFVYIDK